MEDRISEKDKEKIIAGIRDKYSKVAQNPDGQFGYPTGRAGMEALGYEPGLVDELPEAVLSSYCGVGNPFSLGPVNRGEAILDIGCGAGVDTLVAGILTGQSGAAIGIDIVDEMLQRAGQNLELTGFENVSFRQASGEDLPFADNTFDVAISNGAINLIPDKTAAMNEALRVLKPGGRLMIADQISAVQENKPLKDRIDRWFQWEGGTLPGKDFLELLEKVGFENVELVSETGFNSTRKTKGALFRAEKPKR